MKLSDITAWLASERLYAPGAALYAQVGTNKTYLRLFKLPATDYSRQVLVRELEALMNQVKDAIDAPPPGNYLPPPAPAAAAPAPEPPTPAPGAASADLVRLRAQLKAVRDERSYLHPQLTAPNLGTKARYALSVRILDLTDQETELKQLEAHVLEHGRLPGPVATAEVTDEGELRKRLSNLLSRRTKLKKRPDRATDLAAAEADILLIRSKLTS